MAEKRLSAVAQHLVDEHGFTPSMLKGVGGLKAKHDLFHAPLLGEQPGHSHTGAATQEGSWGSGPSVNPPVSSRTILMGLVHDRRGEPRG